MSKNKLKKKELSIVPEETKVDQGGTDQVDDDDFFQCSEDSPAPNRSLRGNTIHVKTISDIENKTKDSKKTKKKKDKSMKKSDSNSSKSPITKQLSITTGKELLGKKHLTLEYENDHNEGDLLVTPDYIVRIDYDLPSALRKKGTVIRK